MFKKVRKFILMLPMLALITACGGGERFDVQGTTANMQGIWGAWSEESGNFEFVEFLGHYIMNGYVTPAGEISFIHMGGYHFHGAVGHALLSIELDSGGYLGNMDEDFHFMVSLNRDQTRMELDKLGDDGRSLVLTYIGQELESLDTELDYIEFFEEAQISQIMNSLWSIMVESDHDHDHDHEHNH